MKNYSKDIFVENLKTKNWDIVKQEKEDAAIALEIFNTMFMQSVNEICPEKEVRIKGRTEPWINSDILEAMWERDRALYKANNNKQNQNLRTNYNKLRNKVITLNRQTKANHFCKKVEENKNNPKQLWNQFKTLGYSNKSKEKSRIILEIDNEKFNQKQLWNQFKTLGYRNKSKEISRIILEIDNEKCF